MGTGESSYRLYLDGDESAFETIVKEYRDPLTFFINGFVHDTHAAEDIAIDVFAFVAAEPKKYNFKVSLKTYLYMLGRSRAIDYIRRRNRQKTVALDEAYHVQEDSLQDEYIKDERKKALYRALNKLPEKMGTAIRLVYFEELSYADASRVMKISKKQIDNLLYRAKGILRSILEEEGELL